MHPTATSHIQQQQSEVVCYFFCMQLTSLTLQYHIQQKNDTSSCPDAKKKKARVGAPIRSITPTNIQIRKRYKIKVALEAAKKNIWSTSPTKQKEVASAVSDAMNRPANPIGTSHMQPSNHIPADGGVKDVSSHLTDLVYCTNLLCANHVTHLYYLNRKTRRLLPALLIT